MKKIFLLFGVLLSHFSFAQVTNDECSTASTLTPSSTCVATSGTIANATTSSITTGCSGYYDVFYKFTASSNAATVTVVPSSGMDARVSFFQTCGTSALVCMDYGYNGQAETLNASDLAIGTTYYIKVSSFSSTPSTNTFTICVQNIAAPSNNDCANAVTLTSNATCTNTTGTLTGASTSSNSYGCVGYNDVFYKFTATSAITSVTIDPSSNLDAVLSVYTSCGTTALTCRDDNYDGDAEVAEFSNLTAGNTYYIKVASRSSNPQANTFTICVQHITPPANDECAGALSISPSTTCTTTNGSLDNAITSTTTSSCSSYKDVFYKFTATSATGYITVVPSASLDAVVSLHSVCGGSSITCMNEGYTGSTETIDFSNLVIGNTYFIKIASGTVLPSTPTFTLCVQNITPIANDVCSGAVTLTPSASCSPTSGTITNATSSNASACGGYKDVFYKFTAASTAVSISVAPSAGLDPSFSISTSCGGSSLRCVDNTYIGETESSELGGLTVGQIYYIAVSSQQSSATSGTFTICVQNLTPVNGDDCATAIALTPAATCVSTNGTLLNATTSVSTTDCGGYKDVFYRFTAIGSAATISVTTSSGLDPKVSVFSNCEGFNIVCRDAGNQGENETVSLTNLTVGSTYYIKVSSYSSTPSTNTFSICVQSQPTPVHDECSGAISLTPSPSCITTSGTIANASTSSITNGCDGYYDVFYKFTATATTASVTITPSSGFDPKLSIFQNCGGSYLRCVDDYVTGVAESVSLTALTIGTTYYIKVASYFNTFTSGTFTICVQGQSPVPPPVNDECNGAITLTPSTSCVSTSGTIANATTSSVTDGCEGYLDVFYKFTATSTTATVSATGSSSLDLVMGIYSGCGTTELYCVDNSYVGGGTESITLNGLTIGHVYSVKLASYWTTSATSTFTVCVTSTIATGTQEAAYLNSINLYPNPAQNTLNITNISDETEVEILNVNGTSLMKKTLSANGAMDLSDLLSGIYIVKLSLNGVTENKRIIVSK